MDHYKRQRAEFWFSQFIANEGRQDGTGSIFHLLVSVTGIWDWKKKKKSTVAKFAYLFYMINVYKNLNLNLFWKNYKIESTAFFSFGH